MYIYSWNDRLNQAKMSNICEQMSQEFSKIVHIDEMSYLHHQKLILTQFGLSLNEKNVRTLFI